MVIQGMIGESYWELVKPLRKLLHSDDQATKNKRLMMRR